MAPRFMNSRRRDAHATLPFWSAASPIPRTLIWVSVAVASVSILPIFFLATRAFDQGIGAFFEVLARPRTSELLINTLLLLVLVCLSSAILGTATAWAVTRLKLPAPRLWKTLVCLPLGVPSFVSAFAWISSFPTISGLVPLAILMTLVSTPFVTVPVMAALTQVDHALADVAQTLGRNRLYVFFSITLPQIAPAIGAGTVIVALYTIADFGAPAMLRYDTLTVGVYGQVISGVAKHSPAAIALLISLIAAVLVVVENRLRRRDHRISTQNYQPSALHLSLPARAATMSILSVIAALSILAPLAALFHRWISYSTSATDWARIGQAALTTIVLAALSATIALLASIGIAYLSARVHSPVVSAIEATTFMGHALPGVVLALAMVSLTLTLTPWAYQSLGALIATYVLLFMPKGIGSARSGFQTVSQETEDVARTLGDSPMRAWLRVSIPGAWAGIAAGWLLVATAVMKELPATLMLRPNSVHTLATELWNNSSIGAYGGAAPVGLALLAVGMIPAIMLSRSLQS